MLTWLKTSSIVFVYYYSTGDDIGFAVEMLKNAAEGTKASLKDNVINGTWEQRGKVAGDVAFTAATIALGAAVSSGSKGAAVAGSADDAARATANSADDVALASTRVTSNLGREIDITPRGNHVISLKISKTKGTPNSSVDILDSKGVLATRRWYDAEDKAFRDVDMTNHRNGGTHAEMPHEHYWDWSSGKGERN